MPKRVTSLWDPSSRHCSCQQPSSFRNVTAVTSVWQHCVPYLNLKSPIPETNALPLDQLAGLDLILFIILLSNFQFSKTSMLVTV